MIVARMNVAVRLALVSLLLYGAAIAAVPKDSERPDKEMLQMMELLKNIDMIKNIDLMQDMQNVDSSSGAAVDGPQKSQAVKKKEAAK